jgi:hypothetical protein
MKHTNIDTAFNFDLCDLQKVGKIKNPGFTTCILIRCTLFGDDPAITSSRIIAHCWFSKMATTQAAIFEVWSGRNSVEM